MPSVRSGDQFAQQRFGDHDLAVLDCPAGQSRVG